MLDTSTMAKFRGTALAYARLGFPVVRTHKVDASRPGGCTCGRVECKKPGKHPIGEPKPTKDLRSIEQWPDTDTYSLGIYPDDSFFVLDLDAKDGGITTLAQWESMHGSIPKTATVRTGGGGFHFYFKRPAGVHITNRVKFAPGADVRASGGFVVAPPSVHQSGRAYEWDLTRGDPRAPLAEAPQWLLDLVVYKATIFDNPDGPTANVDVEATPIKDRLRMAKAALKHHPSAVEGEGGDLTTLQACSIGYDFGVPQAQWQKQVLDYNDRCEPPWELDALAEKLRSAYQNNSPDKPFGWRLRPVHKDPLNRPILTTNSERGLADAWLKERGEVKIVSGYVYAYNTPKGIWERWDDSKIKASLYELHQRDVVTEEGKSGFVNMTAAKVRALLDAARHTTALMDDAFFLNRPRGIVAAGQFIRITPAATIEVTPATPEHRARNAVAVAWDPMADYSRLVALLRHTFEGDPDCEEKIAALQEFVGAMLTGMATDYARALMLVGFGANGKSTIMELIEMILDVAQVASTPPQKWGKHEYVFELVDKLLNSVSEVPDQRILASDTLKQVVSGEALSARPLFGQLMRFKPYAGHIFSANELPEVADHSLGFWRRFLVLTFNRNFQGDPNRKTKDQIKAEFADAGPAILRWALEGAARLVLQRGYTEPSSHIVALAEWKRNTDEVASVIVKCFAPTKDGAETQSAELYACYKEAAEAEGMKPVSHNKFGRALSRVYGKARKSNGKYYYTCRIRPEADWDIPSASESYKERRVFVPEREESAAN